MEHYLNQLLPAVVTCALTSALGPRGGDEHWAVREQAAALAALAARLFGAPYHNVAPRLARLMAKAWMDPSKGFACKYGAVMGLQPGGGQGWDELDRQAALMAKARVLVRQRPIRVRLEVDQQQQQQHQQQQQQQQGRPVALVIEEVGLQSVADVLRRDAEGGGGGDLEALLRRQAPPPARHQQPRGGAGRAAAGGRAAAPQLSVAEVLADAWQEDSDVNAQLGALVHLFGEALLAQLPLGELPSYVM
ncbi:hypothetical protein MNEG_3602 [Monoraphidium neglectum]|uniref:TAF6 C-terminal HEAT repeat domain-containing protein n=1 Tax=Monoraphidium neglectum TaxID=145388 RepID=A0A0D2NH52_9CHLO|nr:hypothetical protein MNEG_3602 [Monoraphidium neglectum]KIZ04361.1 hypothetical protein MNEG_3602 [Monoraphidium neglectum]|eukprot:XP_013903380.1 hypothetical protein MNEG_3602 [Monoraphidium neglectum]